MNDEYKRFKVGDKAWTVDYDGKLDCLVTITWINYDDDDEVDGPACTHVDSDGLVCMNRPCYLRKIIL